MILDYLLVSVERLSMRTEGSPASNRAREKGGEGSRSFGDQAKSNEGGSTAAVFVETSSS